MSVPAEFDLRQSPILPMLGEIILTQWRVSPIVDTGRGFLSRRVATQSCARGRDNVRPRRTCEIDIRDNGPGMAPDCWRSLRAGCGERPIGNLGSAGWGPI